MFRSLVFAVCFSCTALAVSYSHTDRSLTPKAIDWTKVTFVGCDAAALLRFKQGISDALMLANSVAQSSTDFAKDLAVQDLFGKALNAQSVERIRSVQSLAASWSPEGIPAKSGNVPAVAVQIHCNDYRQDNNKGLISCADNAGVAGYADNQYDNNEKFLVKTRFTICKNFFNGAMTLAEREAYFNTNPGHENDLSRIDSLAYYILHELHHLDSIGTTTHIGDLAYSPAGCRRLAKEAGAASTINNADTYAWFAVAKYFQKKFGGYPSELVYPTPKSLSSVADTERIPVNQRPLQLEL